MSNAINQDEILLRKQIREAAGLAFDYQRSANLLFSCNSLISQRASLAYYIDKGMLNNEIEAIAQFKYLNEQIKYALQL